MPDFYDVFLGSRHGIHQNELVKALAAINRSVPPPEAAFIMKQIGSGSFSGEAGKAWFEAKTIELVSVILDWHDRLKNIPSDRLREQDRTRIAEVLQYIGEHVTEPLSLDILAKQSAMSVSKFTAAFKIHTGITASDYMHQVRMEKAMNRLKNTSIPLGEIAETIGYTYHASFSAAFKEHFGIAPFALRKSSNPTS